MSTTVLTECISWLINVTGYYKVEVFTKRPKFTAYCLFHWDTIVP